MFFADPFILNVDDKTIEILVEEFQYKINKGIIVRLLIDLSSYTLIERTIVLECETHLSYPIIYRDKKIFIFILKIINRVLCIYINMIRRLKKLN